MTGSGRKHKRGERGSIEEGQSDPKRTSMAAVEGVHLVTEPSTTELNTRGSKAIIAKFISHKVKTNLYRARTKLKQVKLADFFPDSSYATRVQSTRIFNENLTSYRRRIMSKANEKRRDGELLHAWSMDGTIYVKTSTDGRPIKLIEFEDLENL